MRVITGTVSRICAYILGGLTVLSGYLDLCSWSDNEDLQDLEAQHAGTYLDTDPLIPPSTPTHSPVRASISFTHNACLSPCTDLLPFVTPNGTLALDLTQACLCPPSPCFVGKNIPITSDMQFQFTPAYHLTSTNPSNWHGTANPHVPHRKASPPNSISNAQNVRPLVPIPAPN